MNARSLVRLKEYVSCKKVPPRECLWMIVLGLTLFLCHGLRNASDRNIQDVSTAAVNVLETASLKYSPHEVNGMQVMLMFDKTPVIRQGIIHHFKVKQMYPSEIEALMMTEIQRLLCPFLVVDTKKSVTAHYVNWAVAHGTFSSIPVITLFHIPQENDHELKNETQFINFADTMHTNQINKLLALQHELVISLFAYQLTSIPQFYILEDYITNNLQLALKNRNDNRRYFDYLTLMRFLSCAVEALEYCHSKDIVHRNLTADSLFIVAEYKVKLGGFTLAIDMDAHTELTALSGSSQIPTRWSAPESLSRLKYSKASDVYMFGHLMYEIHTHGALPYSHLSLSTDVFVEQVTRNTISLCHERCMKKEVYDDMCRCVAFDPGDRTDVSTVKESMVNLCKKACRDYKPRFPSLSETPTAHERQPSTVFAKGSPEYEVHTGKLYVRPLNVSTEPGLIQYQMGDGYLFREDVKRKMSQYMLDHLNSSYRGVIPQSMNIHRDDQDTLTFEYYIPSLQVLNILHYVAPLDVYFSAVLKVAETLEILHSASFILGDLSTSTVFVELNNDMDKNMDKVHIVSWAHLNYIQTFSDRSNQTHVLKENPVLARAAPEVAERGIYSPASDVYCFGHFLKEIVAYLNNSVNHYTNISLSEEVIDQWEQCYELMMETAQRCTIFDRRKRLPLVNVMEQINTVIAYLRPNSASQQERASELYQSAGFVSRGTRGYCRQPLSIYSSGTFQRRRTNSETTVKEIFRSDSNDDVTPKQLYEKHNSIDSGMQSIYESCTSIKNTPHSMQFTPDLYSLATHCVEAYDNTRDTSDIYMDAISSPAALNTVYTNIPKPHGILDDIDVDYSQPAEFPLGYMYLQRESHSHTDGPHKQADHREYTSNSLTYIEIENIPSSMSANGHGRVLENSDSNSADSENNGGLLDGVLPASGHDSSLTGFSDTPSTCLGYQHLQDVELQDASADTNHSYESLVFRPADDEREVFV